LIVKVRDFELLVGVVGADLSAPESTAAFTAATSLLTGLLATFFLLFVGHQRNHHAVAAEVNSAGAVFFAAVFGGPVRSNLRLLHRFLNLSAFFFDKLPQRIFTDRKTCGSQQVTGRLLEAHGALIQATGQLAHAAAESRFGLIEQGVDQGFGAIERTMPARA